MFIRINELVSHLSSGSLKLETIRYLACHCDERTRRFHVDVIDL